MLIAMSETMFQSVFATKDTLGIHFQAVTGLQVRHILYSTQNKTLNDFFLNLYLFLILATTPRPIDPCRPSPCGVNAECSDRGGAASCTCLPGLQGNPYVECKPECSINPDCPTTLACVRNKCVDPCPGVCGVGATCSVLSHRPNCRCNPGLIGDPFAACYPPPTSKHIRGHINITHDSSMVL